MRVLVTGGAGYIGSHTVRELINSNHEVTVLDDLSNGHQEAIDPRANFIKGSTGDMELLLHRLHAHQIDTVIHFAASIEVAESVKNPYKYYSNNFSNTLTLLNAMIKIGIKRFLFSSTAAVYGNPEKTPIEENQKRNPINPYGKSKMMSEMAIEDLCHAHGLGYTILRYFNVAGASPDSSIGEDHKPESHLIPRILISARDGSEVRIFGTDYDTKDGTCIRDYIHVVDLARAHVLAVEKMEEGKGTIYNLGSEKGFSVREVISACEKVVEKKIHIFEDIRRSGDPAVLIASSAKIRRELKWAPLYPDIDTIVQHAWQWHSTHPHGYIRTIKVQDHNVHSEPPSNAAPISS
jgi:UDP-glucose 4-epimerase